MMSIFEHLHAAEWVAVGVWGSDLAPGDETEGLFAPALPFPALQGFVWAAVE